MTQDELVSALLIQNAKLRKAIKRFLDGDYPNPRKERPGKCKHGRLYFETCESCNDEHFERALESAGPVPGR